LIRRIGPDEWTVLRDVRLTSLADAPESFGSTYAREADYDEARWRELAEQGGWFIATLGEQVAGIVAGYHDPSSPANQRHLIAMWVAPQARGSGLAAELVEAVVEWSQAAGATELTLGVADGNDRARALYLKCGFVSTRQRFPLHSDPSRNIEIYARDLARAIERQQPDSFEAE
jgi:ribosomal protein S18 acetylase RimI-like enzyme